MLEASFEPAPSYVEAPSIAPPVGGASTFDRVATAPQHLVALPAGESADRTASRRIPVPSRWPRSPRTRAAVLSAWDAAPFVALLFAGAAGFGRPEPLVTSVVALVVAQAAIACQGGYQLSGRSAGPLQSVTLAHSFGLLIRLAVAATLAAWLALLISPGHGVAGPIELAWALAPLWWLLGRGLLAGAVAGATRGERLLILGSGRVAERIAAELARARPEAQVVGRVDDETSASQGGPALLGAVKDLPALVMRERIDRVIVGFSRATDESASEALRACDALGVCVDIVPRMFDLVWDRARLGAVGSLPLLGVKPRGATVPHADVKRALDVVVGTLLVIATLPLLGLIAIAIMLADGRPILFRQERVGRYGRSFQILKFRTMRPPDKGPERADEQPHIERLRAGCESAADTVRAIKRSALPRVTTIGRLLRATSLDELPQLLNVVRADMSLVGPRPLRQFEVDALRPWQHARLLVRPGMTGLWQVRGRSDVDWEDRMQLDYAYVRHHSPLADLQILADTLPAVIGRRGAQ